MRYLENTVIALPRVVKREDTGEGATFPYILKRLMENYTPTDQLKLNIRDLRVLNRAIDALEKEPEGGFYALETDEFDMVIDYKKLHPPFTFYVEFAPYSEEKEYTKHDDLERLVKSGIGNVKWARKQMSNMDWRQMEDEDHKNLVASDPAVQGPLSQMRAAMIQDAIERKMTEEGIKAPPPPVPMAPQTMEPMASMGEPGRAVVAPSSPKPVPGSAANLQNQLAVMRGPGLGQGEGGGGMRR